MVDTRRYAAVTLAFATLLIVTIVAAEAAVLDYNVIATVPPTGFVSPHVGCRPGFGRPWFEDPKSLGMQLGYYQGKLIAQQFLFDVGDTKEMKSWQDLGLVQGASVEKVTFGYSDGGPGPPAYQIMIFYVDTEKINEVCPARFP